jgi:hypothetical protein
VAWCLAALTGPVLFHTVISSVVLSFYWVMWMPAFLALVALGVGELVRTVPMPIPRPGFDRRLSGGATAAVCVVVFAGAAVGDTYGMLTKRFTVARHVSYSDAVRAHGPLVYLRLGERVGTIAADSSPSHHDGSYAGEPTLGVTGLLASDRDPAAAFNGAGEYAFVPGATWMDTPDFTITLWFSTSSTAQYLASRDDYMHTKVWDVLIDSFGRVQLLTFHPGNGAGQAVVSPHGYDDGKPHMVMAVKAGSALRLYLDGRLVATATYSTFIGGPTAPLGIDLARRGNATGDFSGTLDEFAYFGKALSDQDARSLYLLGATPPVTLSSRTAAQRADGRSSGRSCGSSC